MVLTESSWPADTSVPVLESTVGGVLRAAAALAPDGQALTAGAADPSARRHWTYSELLDEAERAARSLVARFEPGEHVAIWAHNIPEWVILEYALGLAGLVLVTINPTLRPDEVRYVLAQSKAAGLFHVDTFRDQSLAAHHRDPRARAARPADGRLVLRMGRVPGCGRPRRGAARRVAGRPSADPVHVGNDRIPEGRPTASSRHHEQRAVHHQLLQQGCRMRSHTDAALSHRRLCDGSARRLQ